jgi:hypothetical protein
MRGYQRKERWFHLAVIAGGSRSDDENDSPQAKEWQFWSDRELGNDSSIDAYTLICPP